MAKFVHIALTSRDPAKTAEFYKEAFGMTELSRSPKDSGANTVWLSDGYIYFNITKLKTDQDADVGEGGSGFAGLHHMGFHVEGDLEEACRTLEQAKAERIGSVGGLAKYKGPDGVIFDIMQVSWDERVADV